MVKTFEDWKGRHSDMQKIDKNIKKHDCGCITKHDDDGNVHVLFSCSNIHWFFHWEYKLKGEGNER